MKNIKPLKIIIDIKSDGTYDNAFLIYKIIHDSGNEDKKTYSISLKSKISVPLINQLINNARQFSQEKENE